MKTAAFLDSLRDRITDDREVGLTIDVHLADIAGWTDLRYLVGGEVIGIPPGKIRNYQPIPKYTTDVGASISFIPDKWVEEYNRRFDGTVRASAHPRGDLGLQRVVEEDDNLIVAMLSVGLQARIALME